MKSITLAVAGAAALALAPLPAVAQTAYPLTCVFAEGQGVGINPSLPRPTTDLVVGFGFRPATRHATEGVDPGTCAWQDRAFRAGEPTTVLHIVRPHWRYVMLQVGTQKVPVLAPTSAPWAVHATQAGYRITFRVYRSEPDAGLAVPFLRVVD
jgi:hypothetical protein